MRLENAARACAHHSAAFALELGKPRDEYIVDVELRVDVDLSAQEKFARLDAHFGGERASPAFAYREPHLFDVDAVGKGLAIDEIGERLFQGHLRGGNGEMPVAYLLRQ